MPHIRLILLLILDWLALCGMHLAKFLPIDVDGPFLFEFAPYALVVLVVIIALIPTRLLTRRPLPFAILPAVVLVTTYGVLGYILKGGPLVEAVATGLFFAFTYFSHPLIILGAINLAATAAIEAIEKRRQPPAIKN